MLVTSPTAINGIAPSVNKPLIALQPAAGSGTTYSITGNNLAGKIVITAGLSLLSTGPILIMTFADNFAFSNGCVCNFSAWDGNFAAILNKLYCTSTTSTITLNTTLALSIGTTYSGIYTVIGW